MELLNLSEKARVLHAALHFPTFTVDELAEFSGVKRETVQSTIGRTPDLIQRIGKEDRKGPGGRAIRYELRTDARERLAREVIELTQQLRPGAEAKEQNFLEAESLESARAALKAVESSIGFARKPADSGENAPYWIKRANRQTELAAQLIPLVSTTAERRSLEYQLAKLRICVEELSPDREPNLLEDWKQFVKVVTRGVKDAVRVPIKSSLKPEPQWGSVKFAPAALFDATDDAVLTTLLTKELRAAKRPYLQVALVDVLEGLKESSGEQAFLSALESASHDVALIVTLDSSKADSRLRVTGFLTLMKDYLWYKNAAEPAIRPEITLIDKAMDAEFVHTVQIVRNLNYVNQVENVSAVAMARLMSAVVRNRDEDAARTF